jgi:hypothetical protein
VVRDVGLRDFRSLQARRRHTTSIRIDLNDPLPGPGPTDDQPPPALPSGPGPSTGAYPPSDPGPSSNPGPLKHEPEEILSELFKGKFKRHISGSRSVNAAQRELQGTLDSREYVSSSAFPVPPTFQLPKS